MTFAGVANNVRLFLVCWVVVLDMGHDNYLMTVTNGYWLPHGLVAAGYDSHTLLHGCLTQRFSVPTVCACDNMQSLHSSDPTWVHLPSLDLWSWFGGLSQGALAAEWVVAVAAAHCRTMVGLHAQACDAPVICGDFGDLAVLPEIWKQSYGASTLSPSSSCQTLFRLGAGFPTTTDAACYLQSWIIVLDCLSPAGADVSVTSDCRLCTGNPGPAHSGSWQDGCAVPYLHLGGFGFKQRTTWFIKVLKQSLQHQLVELSMGYGMRCHDERVRGFPTTIDAAYYFQSWIIVLDCLSPAGADVSVTSTCALGIQDLFTVGLGKMGVQFHIYKWEALDSSSEPGGLSRCSSSPFNIGLSDSPWVTVDHGLTSFCLTLVFYFYHGLLLLTPLTVGSAAFTAVCYWATRKPWLFCHMLPDGCGSLWTLPRFRLPKSGRVPTNSGRELKRDKVWWFGTFFIVPYIGNNHPKWLIFFRGVQTTNQI